MKQILLLFVVTAGIITILGVLNKYPDASKSALTNPGAFIEKAVETSVYNKKEIKIGDKSILVEVVDSPEARNKGLSGKEKLDENEGMLFVFEVKDVKPAFWMKDMKFAIDIIWINDGRISQITKEVAAPQPDTPDRNLPLYIPNTPIDYVLEVNSGFSDKNDLQNGLSVDLSEIN